VDPRLVRKQPPLCCEVTTMVLKTNGHRVGENGRGVFLLSPFLLPLLPLKPLLACCLTLRILILLKCQQICVTTLLQLEVPADSCKSCSERVIVIMLESNSFHIGARVCLECYRPLLTLLD
jgi:hypothetical protein